MWRVYTKGGRQAEQMDVIEWAQNAEQLGVGEILLTSMDADGVQAGFDLPLTSAVREAVRVPVIASGGAGALGDFSTILKVADAALAASVFHFGTFSIAEVKQYVADAGIVVRK
jgi:cyclase